MLSAFTARPIVELKQRDKSKIESILAYGDRLLVGLSTGTLRIYRVNEPIDEPRTEDGAAEQNQTFAGEPKTKVADLLREYDKFSKYKIEQLAIVKEANILVSLSNTYVSIHDLQTYELQEMLTKTKGASAFAITSNIVKDPSTGIPSIVSKLAVAVKRRLLLWSWQDMELASEVSEISLVTGIKTLTWVTGTKIVAGLSSSYVLVDVESFAVTDIVGPGSIGGAAGQDGGRFGSVGVASIGYMGIGGTIPKPLATRLGEGEILLAKDINTFFIDTNGNSLGRGQIRWAVAPEAIGYSYPYLLALQATRGTLEVRNPQTLNLLQTISIPGASQLHVPQPYVSLAHAGKGFLVSSERCIWRMGALEYDSQINALVERRRFDEAISLLYMLEDALVTDKDGRLREIKMTKAEDLFSRGRYASAMELFIDVSAPPERVIRLYPPIIAGEARSSISDAGSHTKGAASEANGGNDETSGVADGSLVGTEDDSASSKLDGAASSKASTQNTSADVSKVKTSGKAAESSSSILEGQDLKEATVELRGFLVSARTRLQRYINFDGSLKEFEQNADQAKEQSERVALLAGITAESNSDLEEKLRQVASLVDTTLFRAYMFASPSLAASLFRLPNFCDPEVVNDKLLETKRYNDLVNFFHGKGLHHEALQLLQNFGEVEEADELAPQLHGPQRTVAYLQSLPPEMVDLILQFAEWPLRKNPELGMEVFLADTENAETLPRARVLDFLESVDEMLAVRYLEHLVQELNDTTPDFHQRLLNEYVGRLKSDDFDNDDDREALKNKTLEFLRSSRCYSPYKALGLIPPDDPVLYEARAIVLSNMGQHRQALDIYVFKLEDPAKAEEYCNQIYVTEEASSSSPTQQRRTIATEPKDIRPSIYHTLLSLYLSPPPPQKPQLEPALDVLAKHGSRLPAASTLNLIPEVLPIKDLESYFRGRIRAANTIVNEGRIVAGIRQSAAFSEEARLRLGDGIRGGNGGRNRRVVITENRVCGVCHKRFGGSAIKVLPNNAVVHYGCSAR